MGTFWKESEALWSKLDQNRKERPRLKSGTSIAGILFVFGCDDRKEELGGGDKECQKQTSWMALPELDPTSTLN